MILEIKKEYVYSVSVLSRTKYLHAVSDILTPEIWRKILSDYI